MKDKAKRLQLKPLQPGDADALSEAVKTSLEVLKRRLRWAAQPAACAEFIARSAVRVNSGEALVFGIFETASEHLVGVAALQELKAVPGVGELSFWVRADRHDRGYATEAAKLILAAGFRGESLQKVDARIDPANRSARKVLKKLRFRYEGCLRHEKRLNGRWIDQECWGLLRGEWKK